MLEALTHALRQTLRRTLTLLDWHARALVWLAASVVLVIALLVGWLSWWLFPHLPHYRARIAAELSSTIGRPVTLGNIEGGWHNTQPYLRFRDVRVLDSSGKVAFSLNEAEGTLSWWPLLIGDLRFDALTAQRPDLVLTRGRDGIIRLADIPLNAGGADDGFANWLLRQHAVGVQQGRLVWRDQLRQAPDLTFEAVDFSLQNLLFGDHIFHLKAKPQANLAAPLEIHGDWRGDTMAGIADWRGSLRAQIGELDLAAAGQWLPYPLEVRAGRGQLDIDLSFRGGVVQRLNATLAVRGAALRLAPELALLEVDALSGKIDWQDSKKQRVLTLSNLQLAAEGGVLVDNGSARLVLPHTGGGEVRAPAITLPALAELPPALPLPDSVRTLLKGVRPSGRIDTFEANWSGNWRRPTAYRAQLGFTGLGLSGPAPWPILGGLDGEIRATEQGGQFKLQAAASPAPIKALASGKKAEGPGKSVPSTPAAGSTSTPAAFTLQAEGVFEKPLQFDGLRLKGNWQQQGVQWTVVVQELAARNADMEAQGRGRWVWPGEGLGHLDMTAEVARASAPRIVDYLPLTLGPDTRAWLKTALLAGEAQDGRFVLKGPLAQFPFADGKSGLWRVDVKPRNVVLDYSPGWPRVEQLDAELQLVGNRLTIKGSGHILGARVETAQAVVEDLERSENITIQGEVRGATSEFFRFIGQSPLDRSLQGFSREARAEGEGLLALTLDIPFENADNTRVAGHYRFQKNRLQITGTTPEITDLAGEVQFNEHSVTAQGITGNALGGATRFDLATLREGTVKVSAAGRVDTRQAAQRYALPLAESLSGSTDYRLELDLPRGGGWQMAVTAPLRETRIDLPAPLNKAAGEPALLRLGVEASAGDERWRVALGKIVSADVRRIPSAEGWKTERSEIRIGEGTPSATRKGLWVLVNLPLLDLDAWEAVLPELGASAGGGQSLPVIENIDLRLGQLWVSGKRLDEVSASLMPSPGNWNIMLASKQMRGTLQWATQGRGKITGRLGGLSLPLPPASANPQTPYPDEPPLRLPALDVVVDDFRFRDHALGQLEIVAQPQRDNWLIDRLSLRNPDGSLTMDGVWRTVGTEQFTSVKVEIDSPAMGKLLERFGYPEAMRRGSGRLWGDVNWNGSPLAPEFTSMSGELHLQVGPGQFAKIEPGVGRLLGILSLQALPRRISLDFRDVFSEGFSFDRIEGDSRILRGVLSTDNLQISGPSAQIAFRGQTDVAAETQQLRVRIVPTIGDSVAVGAGMVLANPVVGVGALLLQRVLKDPLGQLIAYEYDITGHWDDPKVERVGEAPSSKPP